MIIRTCEVGCLVVLSNRRRPDKHVHSASIVEAVTGQGQYHKSFLLEILRRFSTSRNRGDGGPGQAGDAAGVWFRHKKGRCNSISPIFIALYRLV